MNKKSLVNVYTDGGCNPNPGHGGWGFVFVGTNGKFFLENNGGHLNTTNNLMEMTAALEALQLALKHGEKLAVFGQITVWSDSKYLIDGIEKWVHGWQRNGWKTKSNKPVKNIPQWKAILNLENNLLKQYGIRIRWKWIKGHSGNPGNERADELATLGRKKALEGKTLRQPGKRQTPTELPSETAERYFACLNRIIQRAEEYYELMGEFGDLKESYFDACTTLKHTPISARQAA